MRTRYVDQGINSTMIHVQHTRRVTRVQHTKSDSRAVVLLACSTWISLVCSAWNTARVRPVACHTHLTHVSLNKNWRTHACSVHTSVNLEISCTISPCISYLLQYLYITTIIIICMYIPWWLYLSPWHSSHS